MDEICDLLQPFLSASNVSLNIFDVNFSIHSSAFAALNNILEAVPIEIALEKINQLLAEGGLIREAAAQSLSTLAATMPPIKAIEALWPLMHDNNNTYWLLLKVLTQAILSVSYEDILKLRPFVSDPNADANAKGWMAKKIAEAAMVLPDVDPLELVLLIKPLLADPSPQVQEIVIPAFVEVLKKLEPQTSIDVLREFLADPSTTKAAVFGLGNIGYNNPEAAKDAIGLWKSFFSIHDPFSDPSALNTYRLAIAGLVLIKKAVPELAQEVFELLTSFLPNSNVFANTNTIIEGIVETVKDLPNGKAVKLIKTFASTFSQQDGFFIMPMSDSREIALQIMADLIKSEPQWAPETLQFARDMLQTSHLKSSAMKTIAEVAKTSKPLLPKIFELIRPFLSDQSNGEVKKAVIQGITEVALASPELIPMVFELLNNKNLISDQTVSQALIEGFTKIAAADQKLIPQVFPLLKSFLASPVDDIKVVAVKGITGIAYVFPDLAPEALELLKPFIFQPKQGLSLMQEFTQGKIKEEAIKCLPLIAKSSPYLAPKIFELLKSLLHDYGIKELVSESLAKITEILPVNQALELLTPIYHDSHQMPVWIIPEAAERSLAILVKKLPAQQIIGLIQPLFDWGFQDNFASPTGAIVAANVILDVTMKAGVARSDIFELFRSLVTHDGSQTSAAGYLAEVAKILSAQEMLEIMKPLLSSNVSNIVESALACLNIVIKTVPLEQIVHLVDEQSIQIRLAAQKTCLQDMKNPIKTSKLDYTNSLNLLKIASSAAADETSKDLAFAAQNVIKQIATRVDEEGIKWLNIHFSELPHSNETKAFLKIVYHKALRGGDLHATDSEFISKCIELGLTTIITKSGKIIFDGITYNLLPSSMQYLDSISAVALHQPENLLAKQYRDNAPLFPNSGSSLPIAASDLKDVSIVDGMPLQASSWKVSLLHLSNHKYETPTKVFVLLESRGSYGQHIIHKISIEGGNLKITDLSANPQDVNTELRKAIFTEMEYLHTKLKYYVSIFEINKATKDAIIAKAEKYEIAKDQSDLASMPVSAAALSSVSSVTSEQEYHIFHELLDSTLGLGSDSLTSSPSSAAQSFNVTWDKYLKRAGTEEYSKVQLLNLSGEAAAKTGRESASIDRHDKHDQVLKEQKAAIESYQKAASSMEAKIEAAKIGEQDKIAMYTAIKSITTKMESLADKKDIDDITHEMTRLINEAEFTKDNIEALEATIEAMKSSNDPLLNNLEPFEEVVEHASLLGDG